MNQEEIDHVIYSVVRQFIEEEMLEAHGFDRNVLTKYLTPPHQKGDLSHNQLFEQLLLVRMNTRAGGGNHLKKVFGTTWTNDPDKLARWEKVRVWLEDFRPETVLDTYPTVDGVKQSARKLFPDDQFYDTTWGYCQTIHDAATFFSDLSTQRVNFYDWIDVRYQIDPELAADNLSKYIFYFRKALTRDYLKELGYDQYVKPDDQVMNLCYRLGLTNRDKDDEGAIKALKRIATNVGVTPFTVDKLFYILGSGSFYWAGDEAIDTLHATGSAAPKRKDKFIEFVKHKTDLLA